MLFQIKKEQWVDKRQLAKWLATHDSLFNEDVRLYMESDRTLLAQVSKARTIAQLYQRP